MERLEGTVLELQREALLVTVSKATADALSAAGTGAWRVQREPEWQVGWEAQAWLPQWVSCRIVCTVAWSAAHPVHMALLQAPLPAHPRCTGVYWRLDQGSSSVTVTRQLAALAQLGQVRPGSSQGELAVQALLLGAAAAERVASKPTAWVQQEGWLQKARQRLAAVPNLNRSQKEAIAFALSRTLTLWQVRRWCRGCVLKLQFQAPRGAAAGHGLQSAWVPC